MKTDEPIEVSESKYKEMMNDFSGIIAGRKTADGKFYIKCMINKYLNYVKLQLKRP